MNRWLWLLLVGVLGYIAYDLLSDGRPLLALAYLALILVIAWRTAPWRTARPRTPQEVTAMSDSGPLEGVVIYWRPGCGFCARLRSALGQAGEKATWVNIWEDEAGREVVRSVNRGNETVPTVVIDGQAHTNPDPQLVRARLEG